jgi:hypothetical protein
MAKKEEAEYTDIGRHFALPLLWRCFMKTKTFCKVLGLSLLSFGIGILSSFFLPESVLVVIEALVIIAVGSLYFIQK